MDLVNRRIDQECLRITKDIISSIKTKDLKNSKIVKDHLKTLNGLHLWKLNEYYSNKRFNTVPWDLLTFEQRNKLEEYGVSRNCKDYGIDGISEDFKTSLQTKYRDNTFINWTEFSTFQTFSSLFKCDNLILNILDTSKYHHLINLYIQKSLTIPITNKDEFLDSIVKFITDNSKLITKLRKPIKSKVKELRSCQKEAIDIFIKRFDKMEKIEKICENIKIKGNSNYKQYNNFSDDEKKKFNKEVIDYQSTNLQLCSGVGKSLIIKEIIDLYLNNQKGNVLVLIPSKLLCQQLTNTLKDFDPIVYDADKGGKKDADKGGNKDTKEKNEEKKSRVYITVYNSINKFKHIKFDLKIIDEAHHLDIPIKRKTYRKEIQSLKVRHTVSLSATFHKETELHYKYTIEQGIKDGFINDYEIIIPHFKNPDELNKQLDNIVK